MTSDDLKLTELLCARLCHDLAGPVGAVASGAELLSDGGEMAGELAAEALVLLEGSAAAASARLRFLRLALGGAGGAVPAAALRDMVDNFLGGASSGGDGVTLDWQDAETGAWDADRAKLLCNLILLARDCLVRGGCLEVRARQPGGTAVTARGKGAAPAESATAIGRQEMDGLSPRGAQGVYAAGVAARCGTTISVRADLDSVAFLVG